jgi:ElaB/YqjD/DUF883 family membrane-anchored ribosome-binding protein
MNKVAKPPGTNLPPGEDNGNPPMPQANLPPRKTGPSSFEDLLDEFGELTSRKHKPAKDKVSKAENARKKAEQTLDKTRKKVSQRMTQVEEPKNFEAREKERRERNAYDEASLEKFKPSYETEANKVNYEDQDNAAYEGLDDHKKRFAPFDLEIGASNASKYARLLKDPQGIKTVFVLSEILKRKYK